MKPSQLSKAYRTPIALISCLVFTLAMSTACSKTGAAASSAAAANPAGISGTATADGINGGAVTAYGVNSDGSRGPAIASTITDANGNYTLDVISTTPVLIGIKGGTYRDETTGNLVNASSAELVTLLPSTSANQDVGISAMTSIAANQALTSIAANNNGSMATVSALIVGANAAAAQTYGVPDITISATSGLVNGNTPKSAAAAQLALLNGAISQMAATLNAAGGGGGTATVFDVMTALSQAAAYGNGKFSGKITGSDGSTAVPIPVPGVPGGVNLTNLLGAGNATTAANNSSFATAMTTAMNTFKAAHTANINAAADAAGITITAPTVPTAAPPALATLASAAAGTTINLSAAVPPAVLPSTSPLTAGPPQIAGLPPATGSMAVVQSVTCTPSGGTAADESNGATITRKVLGQGGSMMTYAFSNGCIKSEITQAAMITPTTLNILSLGVNCTGPCTSNQCTAPTNSGAAPSAPTSQQQTAMETAAANAIGSAQASTINGATDSSIATAALNAAIATGTCDGQGGSSSSTGPTPCAAAFIASLQAAGVKGSMTTGPIAAAMIAVQAASPQAGGGTAPTPVTWTTATTSTGAMTMTANSCAMFGINTAGSTATITFAAPTLPTAGM